MARRVGIEDVSCDDAWLVTRIPSNGVTDDAIFVITNAANGKFQAETFGFASPAPQPQTNSLRLRRIRLRGEHAIVMQQNL